MAVAVSLQSVTKAYGRKLALDHLSVEFPAGSLVGFLGPNGAGKTTTFKTMLGMTRPSEGAIEVLGMRVGPDTHRLVKRLGAMVDEPAVHKTLSGRDNLAVAAHTLGRGAERIPELLDFVELEDVADHRVNRYSKGMRQRLALAMAMVGDPELLILDEPLDGLDPAGQASVRARLSGLVADQGKTVIISSHILADVEQLVDHVIVINRGTLVAAGPLATMVGSTSSHLLEVGDTAAAMAVLTRAGIEVEVTAGRLRVIEADGGIINRRLAEAGIYLSSLVPERTSLEQVFLDLTA